MTDLDLDALEGMLERATKGPFATGMASVLKPPVPRNIHGSNGYLVPSPIKSEDAYLIASALNALPALIANARRAGRYRTALERIYALSVKMDDVKGDAVERAIIALERMLALVDDANIILREALANDGGEG